MLDGHLYALLTRHCNLSCPYCDVKDQKENFNHDKFIDELVKFNGRITLFGGEPTLYRDRLLEVVYNDEIYPKIQSITTNLMVVDDELISVFKTIPGLGTSWNPSRFRNNEYDIWKNNLDRLDGHKQLRVLVTMTFDLLDMSPADVADIMSTWNRNTVASIMFENLVDDLVDEEYFRRVDEWLCKIFDYRESLPRLITNMGDYCVRYLDCSNEYTLTPDGILKHGCPHIQAKYVPDACYSCELVGECRPCILQKYCSVPKKLYNKLRAEKMNN